MMETQTSEATTSVTTLSDNSGILNRLGLGSLDTGYLFIAMAVLMVIFIILLIVVLVKNKKLTERYERFMQGPEADSLEGTMQKLIADVNRLKKDAKSFANDIDLLFQKNEIVFQKSALYKYDAFRELGGKLSSCLVLLDEHDDGFLLNSVHTSNGCYVYCKSIRGGQSELELSTEEKTAIQQALNDTGTT